MAKRVGNLYQVNCTYEQLYYAYLKAAEGKRYRADVLEFTENLESNLLTLLEELKTHTYKVGAYREFYVYEPKRRLIMALPFRDRVIQWWLYRILYPLFTRTFIDDSYACIRGKGQKTAADRVQYLLRQTAVLGGKWYVLKLDMAKYFYRVKHSTLLEIAARKVKDKEILQLLQLLVEGDSTPFGIELCDDISEAVRITDRGMPIGNLTSQLLANVYLNELDQYCKHTLKVRRYVRYMDDIIILSDSKQELHDILSCITEFLETHLQLTLNDKTTIRPVTMGVPFIGLDIWATHRTLRKKSSLRVRRRLLWSARQYAAGNIDYEKFDATLQSYLGLLKYNNCHRFKVKLLADVKTIIEERKDGIIIWNQLVRKPLTAVAS